MATTGIATQPEVFYPQARRSAPPRLYGWPLYIMFVGYPLWWFLGIGAFLWPVMAVPMGLSLLTRQRVRAPKGFGFYLLFVLLMLVSGIQVSGVDRWVGFVYRASLYLSVGVMLLYVYNAPSRLLPTARVVRIMVFFFGVTAAGGLLGVVAPYLEFSTLTESLMPARLLQNSYVRELVHASTAQLQTFLGYPVPRPKAPFVFTNDWGGVYALLVPFLLAGWAHVRGFLSRGLIRLLAVASLVPVIFSLNRILWLCLVVCLVYGSTRFAIRGRAGALQGLGAFLVIFTLILNFGPTKQLIDDRLVTPHSNKGRTTLYTEAASGVSKSPLLGYGAPRPSQRNPNLPPVGTQGQFWLVFYSHGIPATFFWLAFFFYALWRTRRVVSNTGLWCHMVVLMAIVQMPFYGLIPTQMHIVAIAVALAFREMSDHAQATRSAAALVDGNGASTNGAHTNGDGAWKYRNVL
jgi:polysaccharide biosynthesis protein PslJ